MNRDKITIREPLLSRTRHLDPETIVLRVPPGMTSQSAIVSRTDEGHPLIYWAGCQAQIQDGRRSGCGALGCFVSLAAAVELGDKRVLVRDKMGAPAQDVWMIAEIGRLCGGCNECQPIPLEQGELTAGCDGTGVVPL